jgi:hypothetical protein
MTVREFSSYYPGLIPSAFSGFAGRNGWSAHFSDDTLDTYGFSQGITLYQDLFKKDLGDYSAFYNYYTARYGAPRLRTENSTAYADPEKRSRKHDRDTLRAAAWETRGMEISLLYCLTGNYLVDEEDNEVNAPPRQNYYVLSIEFRKRATPDPSLEEEPVYLGMDARQYAKGHPEEFPGGIVRIQGQWQQEAVRHGLKGAWTFFFDRDTMTGMMWDAYSHVLNDSTLALHFSAWEKIVQEDQAKFGEPYSLARGDSQLVSEKLQKGTWKRSPSEARWKVKGGYCVAEFHCYRGKGELFMLTKEEYSMKERDY